MPDHGYRHRFVTERVAAAAALHDALAGAVAGRGRLVLVTGEAGVGKTTLVRDATAAASDAGAQVVWTACWPEESDVHTPWRRALRSLGDEGAHVASVLERTTTNDPAAAVAGRTAVYERVVETLASAAREQPLVLVLDDLHWADEGTIELLAVVRGRLPALPVLVVGTYRDEEVARETTLTRLASPADRVALAPFGRAGTRDVLVSVLDREIDEPVVDDVLRRTGGNPFLVVQVARLLASGDDVTLPVGARDVLQRRLARLPEAVQTVLAAAAVFGAPVTATQLATVTDLGADVVLDALDTATTARVVERATTAGRWSFVHDLFRVAVLDQLASKQLVAMHRRCAALLMDEHAPPALVAHHLLAAMSGPDTDAAQWSLRAAEAALDARAWEDATVHAQRAMHALPSGADADDLRAEAWLMLGRARLCAADPEGTTAAFTTAAALARSTGSPALLARAALGFAADLAGFEVRLFDQRQIDLLEEAAGVLAHADEPALLARVLARLSVALSFAAPTERRLALAEQAVALARAVNDPLVLAGALAAHCDAIAGPSDTERRLAEADEIVALAHSAGDAGLELLGRRLRFVARLELGDLTGATDEMHSFALRADETGNPLYRWYVPLWRGMWALANGEIDVASAYADEAEVLGARAGSVNAPMLATVLRAELLYQAGRTTETRQMLERVDEVLGDLSDSLQAVGNMARFRLALGDTVDAGAELDRLAAAGVDAMPRDAEWLPGIATVLDAAARTRHPILVDAVAAATPYARRFAVEGIGAAMHGSLARFLAAAHLVLGDHERAVAFARQALDANRGAGRLVVAHSQRTLADALDALDALDTTDSIGDTRSEASRLHASADATFAAMGLEQFVRGDGPRERAAPDRVADDASLVREGEMWHVSFRGHTTVLKHAKGIADLALLVTRPGVDVHVTELEGLPRDVAVAARSTGGDGALDRRAIAEYRARLTDVERELADAEDAHDLGRAERARAERDFLVDELVSAVGLRGHSRSAGPQPVERLRKAVTARIRDAIRRIDAAHPALGRHLTNAVRTGTYCSYVPEQPVVWRCETGTRASGA